MKFIVSIAPFFLICTHAACTSEILDGGSSSPKTEGGTEQPDGARSSSGGNGGTGSKTFGESCTDSAECGAGLACLNFSVHPSGGACEVVGKLCSKSCTSGDADACANLDAPAMCFEGCSAGAAVCGQFSGSSDSMTFTVDDAPEALTPSADDVLFVLTVKALAPVRPYAASSVEVVVQAPGETGQIVPCQHDDTNKNGNLDIGETLRCSEPPVNQFGPADVGKTFNVEVVERTSVSGPYLSRGAATWKPLN